MFKKIYSFLTLLTAFLWLGSGSVWGASPLTVADGSATNDKVPVWGGWLDGDNGSRNQLLYPASLLSEMENKNITSMTFYLSSSAAATWTSNFTIGLAVVEETKFADNGGWTKTYYYNSATTTTVYTGTLDATGSTLVITFSDPFLYEGGNLLVNFSATKGNYKDATFSGENQSVCLSLASHNGLATTETGNGYTFLPKTSFAYEDAAPVTCAKPTTVEVAEENIESNSATITLAGLNNATVEYKKKSATDYSVAETAVTGTSYELTGLDSYTEYDVQVKNVCGGTDGESKYVKASFRTKCGAKTIPFAEVYGFEDSETGSGKLPGCWTAKSYATSYYTYPYVGENSSWSTYSHAGSKYLYFYGGTSSSSQSVILPEMSADLKDYTLTFYYNNGTTDTDYSSITVGYYETDGDYTSTFHQIGDALPVVSSYTLAEIDLKDVPTTIKHLVINYSSGSYQHAAYVDDINIQVTPSCEKPTLNDATAQTFEGATFTWDGSAAQFQYAVVASGASVETWSEPISEKTYTVTGKAAATTFDFYVRSYCGTTEQSESVKKSFTTATIPAPTAPQVANATTTTADFSWTAAAGVSGYQYVTALSGQDPDWNNAQNTTATSVQLENLLAGNTYVAYVRSFYSNNNCYSAVVASDAFDTQCEAKTIDATHSFTETFDALHCWTLTDCKSSTGIVYNKYDNRFCFYYTTTPPQYLISPEFVTEDRQVTVEFEYYKHTSGTETFHLGYSTTTKEVDAFTFLEEVTVTNTSAEIYTKNLPAGVKYVAIKYTANDQYYLYIDNFTVTEYVAPACAAPESVSVVENSVTPEGATLSWASVGEGAEYQYAVKESGEPEAGDWSAATTETSVAISGKTAGTTYTFYVRTKCTTSESAVVSTTFTPVITAPSNVTIASITNEGANASWDAGNVSTYKWCVVEKDQAATWDQTATTNSASLENLDADKEYDFYVKSYYEATGAEAAAEKVTFRTKCNPFTVSATATYEIKFEDGIPACWDATEYTKQYSFYNYAWEANNAGQDGNCIRFYNYYTTHVLATEPIVLSADAALKCYYKNTKGSNFQVMISVDGAARVNLGEALGTATAWTEKEIDLTAYTNHTVVLYFCGNSSTAYDPYLYLDELTITAWPACRKPATINPVTEFTGYTATISWTAGGTATDYQYAVALKDETPVWEAANVVNALTVGLTNLTPLTAYDVYVRTYCGDGVDEQSEAQKVSFTTGCGVLATPVEVAFENALPGCWTATDATYTWAPYNRGSNNYCVRFDSYMNGNGNTADLQTAQYLLADNLTLKFTCKNKDGGAFSVDMHVVETSATVNLFTDLTGIADWTVKEYDLSAYAGKTVYFTFHGTSNEHDYYSGVDAYLYVDDFRLIRSLNLADNVDNSAILDASVGQTFDDVTIGRTLVAADYFNTICLPFDLPTLIGTPLEGSDLWAFKYAAESADSLLFRIVEASSIEAGVPYFIAFPNANENIVNPLFKNVTIAATAGKHIGDASVAEFVGILDQPETFTHGDQNKLFLAANNTLYWWNGTSDSQLNAFRAFFQTSSNNPVIRRGMPVRIVKQEEVATDLDNIYEGESAQKRLENNQVVIIRNGVKYTIQGQVISK